MKTITVCADDYAMHPSVSKAIIALGIQQRIHATSCLVTSNYWLQCAGMLDEVARKVDIGLHLNLTEGKGLSATYMDGFPTLGNLLVSSHLRRLNLEKIEEEVFAQYQMFVDTTGHHPDFIDGHQHVHHLPIVRKALITTIKRFNPPGDFWVRSVTPMEGISPSLKSIVIKASGARSLKTSLHHYGIKTNKAFAGVYSLADDAGFRELMKKWLSALPDGGLIMCHPGKWSKGAAIDHQKTRTKEFEYLSSDQFTEDCEAYSVQLGRLSDG